MKTAHTIIRPVSRVLDSDLFYSFRRSTLTVITASVTVVIIGAALFAPWVAPHSPFDLSTIDLMDAFIPPVWMEGGDPRFLLGTDEIGRDLLSTMLYGARISISIGVGAVILSLILGVGLGLLSGYFGGRLDAIIMRLADVQLCFPELLVAILLDGITRALLPRELHKDFAVWILLAALGVAAWVQYARTVRSSTMVQKNMEYVEAARVIGVKKTRIILQHILPNVMGPVLVIATIHVAMAILFEATLSFLGLGVPPSKPSLGTLIRIGSNYLFSGEWWITIFPGSLLAILVLSVNVLGDWIHDAFNPKLR